MLAKWHSRWRHGDEAALSHRSSRPANSPRQTDREVVDLVNRLRRGMKVGAAMLVVEFKLVAIDLAASTIGRILVRRDVSRQRDLDVSGEAIRVVPVRYEHLVAAHLVHVEVKKLGRMPGGGWRALSRGTDGHHAFNRGAQRPGDTYLHTAIDDHSRPAYTEELPDEKGWTAAASRKRAQVSSAPTASRTSAGCSPTTDPATGPPCSTKPWATRPTNTPGPTAHRPTAKLNASTAPWLTN